MKDIQALIFIINLRWKFNFSVQNNCFWTSFIWLLCNKINPFINIIIVSVNLWKHFPFLWHNTEEHWLCLDIIIFQQPFAFKSENILECIYHKPHNFWLSMRINYEHISEGSIKLHSIERLEKINLNKIDTYIMFAKIP